MNEKLEKIISLMERDDSVAAPADSIRWAKNLFAAHAITKPSLLRRLVATLQAELKPNAVILGERSASAQQERQMLFVAGDVGVDLRIAETKKKFRLRGQTLSETFEPVKVLLSSDSGSIEANIVNGDEFTFDSLVGGVYTLAISSLETEIVIEDLSI
jgi:hypothetical protein